MRFTTHKEEVVVVRLEQDGDNVHIYANEHRVASFRTGNDCLTIHIDVCQRAGIRWITTN